MLHAHSFTQTFHASAHEGIVAEAYRAAMDPLQPLPSPGLLGPSRFERTVVEIAGDPPIANKVQISDRSIEKLSATLGAMGMQDWEGRLSEVEGLHRKAVILARDIRDWQV